MITAKGAQTRQRIIEAAAPVFNRRGYAGVSMRDVMEATGLQKGGIYRHFASKEEIALAAFEHTYAVYEAFWKQQMASAETPLEKLRACLQGYRQIGEAPIIPGGCPILNAAIDSDNGSSALRERVRTAMHRWQRILRRLVQQGIACGEVRRDTDPDEVVTILITALEGAIMMSRLYRDVLYLHQTIDFLDRYLERDIRAV